ncbi:ATPase-like histidine kinase, partial [Pseudomonas cannabina]
MPRPTTIFSTCSRLRGDCLLPQRCIWSLPIEILFGAHTMSEHTRDSGPDAALEAALAECAREPIRVPGAIQPHGVLLTVTGDPLCIEQVSANCADKLGLEASELLGVPLSQWVSPEHARLITQAYQKPGAADIEPLRLSFAATDYSAVLHRSADVLIIELEPYVEPAREQPGVITRVLRNLHAATDLETLFDISVHEIQALTGYDRVLIYRFEPQGHGEVVAEALTGTLPSYSGLHFPGSDIPAQARELYRLNWIRVIPDAGYIPVPLIPTLRPDTGLPLDLSFSSLRSVSPVHCEYLKNMGIGSSMSISLLDNGELWGLIACGHPDPLLVSREYRDACAMIGQLLSVKISAIVATQLQREREEKVALLRQLADAMSHADHEILDGLVGRPELLQSLTQAQGAAVLIDDHLHLFGDCPAPEQVRALHRWIRDEGMLGQRRHEHAKGLQGLGIFYTDSMQQHCIDSKAYRDVASGVIAFTLPKPVDNAVMWFRPQLTSTMNWSGDPA